MTQLLLRLFVKNHQDTQSPAVREGYGKLAGLTGIVVNALLCAGKLLAGALSGSVSIMADAINNLSDAASSIVTLLGFKLAAKPADDAHPYGHQRVEYLAGLTVAALILLIGAELVKSSIQRILHPEAVAFTAVGAAVLLLSIAAKLWLCLFYRKLGKSIRSEALLASAADSRNDVASTAAVLAAYAFAYFTHIQIDGWAGLLVAVFILWSGVGIAKDTIDPLLGEGTIMTLRMKNGSETVYTSDADCIDLPITVLIDDQSISAAEFFAAALQEYDRATLVGTHTTGKGRAQRTYQLSDGSAVNLSVEEYFTPKGKSLADVGIAPDIEVKLTDEQTQNFFFLTSETDPQLQKAMETVG